MTNNPKVSVVITCHNYAKYVEKAIKSVLEQTYESIELIIINDGSTDNSLEVIKRYETDARVKIIDRENRGTVFTRNESLRIATGDYIVQLDADDYLDLDYIQTTLTCALKNKSDVVYTNFKKFGIVSEESNFPKYSLEELKNHNFIHISSLIHKSAVGNVQFDEELSNMTHEDWDFFLSLGVKGVKMTLCKDTFLHYRIHRTGRNNILSSHEERLRYTFVYSYITKKHSSAGTPGFDYLIGTIFADWYQMAGNEITALKKRQEDLQGELDAIKSSKTYRALRNIARIKHFMKR